MYPEHEKLKALGGKNQVVGDFVEWLGEKGFTICESGCGPGSEIYEPAFKRTEEWIAEFFEIDAEKLENEKRQMLDKIRADNAKRKD